MPAQQPDRVLMTADTVGGVWTFALELARALGEAGVGVALATMGGSSTREQRSEALTIPGLDLFESDYRLPWMDQPWDDVRRAGDWLLDLATRTGPAVVHLNEPVHGSLAWPAPVVAVAHSCVLSWWQSVRRGSAPPEWDRYRAEMRQGLHGADAVVAPSEWMLSSLRRNYGIENGRVILNGRDAAAFSPGPKEPVVFAAGRLWDPAKNLMALEAAAASVPWAIYIAGDPSHPGGTGTPLSAERLHLLGRLSTDSVAAWLRKASIYAFPARYEPFGLSVLEAALAGCALVLGDIPTLRELWDGSAVFVPPDEPEALQRALRGLIADSELRQALAMRARRRALTLTPQRMAAAYLELYAELLTNASSHAEEAACAS
jgi:glycosyltransferase involved in cell wall biosynthesis